MPYLCIGYLLLNTSAIIVALAAANVAPVAYVNCATSLGAAATPCLLLLLLIACLLLLYNVAARVLDDAASALALCVVLFLTLNPTNILSCKCISFSLRH